MCIIFIAKNVHPDAPLVIAGNRDEFYERPTQSPHWWEEAPHLFAGKDLQAGGTWLGYNKQNRIAGITNLRRLDWYKSDAKSRGELVKGFLDIETDDTELAIAEYTEFLSANYDLYNPFNLLFGDSKRLVIFSTATGQAQEVQDGVHALSNGEPDVLWPKMLRGIEQVRSCIVDEQSFRTQELFSILSDKAMAPVNSLPSTGLSLEEETLLSSIFIPETSLRGMSYGTRSSSVIWLRDDGGEENLFMETAEFKISV